MNASTEVLPSGWTRRRVGDVLALRNGYAFKAADWSQSGRPIIRIQNLKSESAVHNYYDGTLPDRFLAKPGDLLFAWSGTPGTSFGAHVWDGPEAWINQHIFRVDFSSEDFDRDFLKLALNFNLDDYISEAQGGVGLAHITKAKLNDSLLVTPPLHMQRQIAMRVAKLAENRVSTLTHLNVARRSIGRFRQAVLAAACSGRLTTDWREQRSKNLPLLDTGVKRLPKQLRPLDSYDLDELPDEWLWLQVEDVLPAGGVFDGPFGSNLKSSDYTECGSRVVRLENIGHLEFISTKRTYVQRKKYQALRKHAVYPGDIIFSSFVEERVRVCVLPKDLDSEALAKADCFTLRPVNEIDRHYLSLQLACPRSHRFLAGDIHGATRPRVNTTQLRSLPIPLCSLEEQREIVRRYQQLAASAASILARVDAVSRRVDGSSQAILAKALRGELVSNGSASPTVSL